MKKVLLALLFPTLAFAGDPKDAAKDAKKAPVAAPAQPAPPPEVKQTVDAFKGNWTYDATLTPTNVPGMDKPVKFKVTMACKAIAAGNAAQCDGKAKTPMGPWDATFVIAYDPYSKAVHFFGFTSDFEVHDHVCQWKGTDLACTPLKAGTGPTGEEITEDLSMHFGKNTLDFTSTTHGKGGMTMVFEGKGKK